MCACALRVGSVGSGLVRISLLSHVLENNPEHAADGSWSLTYLELKSTLRALRVFLIQFDAHLCVLAWEQREFFPRPTSAGIREVSHFRITEGNNPSDRRGLQWKERMQAIGLLGVFRERLTGPLSMYVGLGCPLACFLARASSSQSVVPWAISVTIDK